MSYNEATILGRLGDDPDLNQTQGGDSVCNLWVATNRKYNDRQGNTKEETTWHDVVVWGDQAENCAKYLSQGRRVFIKGRLEKSKYTDHNGVERTSWEIVARKVVFLGGEPNGAKRQGQPKQQPSPDNPASGGGGGGGWPDEDGETDPFDDDEIPF